MGRGLDCALGSGVTAQGVAGCCLWHRAPIFRQGPDLEILGIVAVGVKAPPSR